MDGATCCWGAYTCYTWCIGSYTDKKNVSLQAPSNILSFYHWQKSQIVWACVHGESAGWERNREASQSRPHLFGLLEKASCSPFHPSDLTVAPQHHLLGLSLRPIDLNLFSEHPASYMLQSNSSSDLIVQNSAGIKRCCFFFVFFFRQSVPAVHWSNLAISCSFFLAMSGETLRMSCASSYDSLFACV